MADLPRFSPPAVPQGWDKVARPPTGAVWTAVEPVDLARPDRFRANLVLTRDDLGGLTFRDWQVASDEVLPTMLQDYLLVDLERPPARPTTSTTRPGRSPWSSGSSPTVTAAGR